jgi:hypothetical protein
VLGNAYWRRAYGGDRSVVPARIVIGEQPFTIIGVARPDSSGEQLTARRSVRSAVEMMRERKRVDDNHGMKVVSLVVRLRDWSRSLAAAHDRNSGDPG